MSNSVYTEDDLFTVYVYPDGENYDGPPDWKSDDFIIRKSTNCNVCGYTLYLSYDEPFATCECGTQEWYK